MKSFSKSIFAQRIIKIVNGLFWNSLEYDYEILPGFTLELGELVCSINFAIIPKIREYKPDIIVLSGGYIHITMILAMLYAKIFHIPIIYRSDQTSDNRIKSSRLAKAASIIERLIIINSDGII